MGSDPIDFVDAMCGSFQAFSDGRNTVPGHDDGQDRLALFYCRTPCGNVRDGKSVLNIPGKNKIPGRKQDCLANQMICLRFINPRQPVGTGIAVKPDRLAAESKFQYLDRCGVPGVDFNRVNPVLIFYRVDAEQAHEFKFAGDHFSHMAPYPVIGVIQLQRTDAAAITEFSSMEFRQTDQLPGHPQQPATPLTANVYRRKTVALEVFLQVVPLVNGLSSIVSGTDTAGAAQGFYQPVIEVGGRTPAYNMRGHA